MSPSPTAASTKKKELDQFLTEEGMKAFLHAHSKHGSEYAETFSAFLVQAGSNNYIELFMSTMQSALVTTPKFLAFMHEIHAYFS